MVMLRAVFCRIAEVLTVQADVLLLHSVPEKGLVRAQHRVQTCSTKVSMISFIHWGIFKQAFFLIV